MRFVKQVLSFGRTFSNQAASSQPTMATTLVNAFRRLNPTERAEHERYVIETQKISPATRPALFRTNDLTTVQLKKQTDVNPLFSPVLQAVKEGFENVQEYQVAPSPKETIAHKIAKEFLANPSDKMTLANLQKMLTKDPIEKLDYLEKFPDELAKTVMLANAQFQNALDEADKALKEENKVDETEKAFSNMKLS